MALEGITVFSWENLSSDPDKKTIVDGAWPSDLRVLHRSFGHRTNSAAPCDTGACRQVPFCTSILRGLVGRRSRENTVSV